MTTAGLTKVQKAAIAQFQAVTGADAATAQHALQVSAISNSEFDSGINWTFHMYVLKQASPL